MTIHRDMYDKKGQTMLHPFNRHILITPEYIEREKKERSTILLLTTIQRRANIACNCTRYSRNCRLKVWQQARILVDRAMIEEVEFEGKAILFWITM